MNPVKFKEIIRETASRTDQPSHLVQSILELYFKELRIVLTTLSHPRVQLFNLGTFQLKPSVLEKKLSAKRFHLQKNVNLASDARASNEQLQLEIDAMQKILTTVNTEKIRKQQFKQNRNHHE